MLQLRTAMVKGETGTMALDVRASLDKGVSTFVFVNPHVCGKRALSFIFEGFFFFLSYLSFVPFKGDTFYSWILSTGTCCLSSSLPSLLSVCTLCLSQRRVMFLKNDYFYTVINETPFRFV